jgi:prephenate dehydrogenase
LAKEAKESAIFELASAGFESTVRLAKSSSAMWAPIFLQNREQVLDVLNEHLLQLEKFRDQIAAGSAEGLIALIEKANQIKRILG